MQSDLQYKTRSIWQATTQIIFPEEISFPICAAPPLTYFFVLLLISFGLGSGVSSFKAELQTNSLSSDKIQNLDFWIYEFISRSTFFFFLTTQNWKENLLIGHHFFWPIRHLFSHLLKKITINITKYLWKKIADSEFKIQGLI